MPPAEDPPVLLILWLGGIEHQPGCVGHHPIEIHILLTRDVGELSQRTVIDQAGSVAVARAALIQLEHQASAVVRVQLEVGPLPAQLDETPLRFGTLPVGGEVQRLLACAGDDRAVLVIPLLNSRPPLINAAMGISHGPHELVLVALDLPSLGKAQLRAEHIATHVAELCSSLVLPAPIVRVPNPVQLFKALHSVVGHQHVDELGPCCVLPPVSTPFPHRLPIVRRCLAFDLLVAWLCHPVTRWQVTNRYAHLPDLLLQRNLVMVKRHGLLLQVVDAAQDRLVHGLGDVIPPLPAHAAAGGSQ